MTDPNERPLDTTEALDEDELGVDPLEEGIDPAERWSGVEHASLDERLAEEEPDVTA